MAVSGEDDVRHSRELVLEARERALDAGECHLALPSRRGAAPMREARPGKRAQRSKVVLSALPPGAVACD